MLPLVDAKSKEIDGVIYHVMPLPSRACALLAARIMRMAAPAFGDVASLVAASKAINSALDALAAGLFESIDGDVIVYAMETLGRVTEYQIGDRRLPMIGEKADYLDEHFRGRPVAMMQWLAFAASVSFPFAMATPRSPGVAAPAQE
jgi:hypothetical protein